MRFLAAFTLILASACAPVYDVVIQGGRVMDPESGLDAVRNIGLIGDKIAAISEGALDGKIVLDGGGLVVAPGFIDLHEHGQSAENYKAQIHDGVTTALELEIGVDDIDAWYAEREGQAPVNYGAAISHPHVREIVADKKTEGMDSPTLAEPLTPEQTDSVKARLRQGLEQGALAVGFGIAYTPGATQEEVNEMFRVAAEFNAAGHVHMRTDYETFDNFNEVLTAAETAGAPLHIVHINSSGRDRAFEYLQLIEEAQKRGVDVTTECYPYNRGSTLIESHRYDDWETYTDEEISEFILVSTGESLTRETFAQYRKTGGTIISPAYYSDETVRGLVAHPLTMIASDGMWITNGRTHPRSFGTYSRVLGKYVREEKALSLMDALAKMTIRPAQRLEKRAPMMRDKGRIREGADADIVVFDPQTIIDRATYQDPIQHSEGMRHVLVNGVATIRDGRWVEDANAGRAIRAPRSGEAAQ